MKKIILWSVAGILIVTIAAGAFWWLNRPQVIHVDNNTTLTLVGVEYGKHHKFPAVKTTGRRSNRGGSESFDTTNDTLVVWVLRQQKPNQPRYGLQALAYDQAQTAAVMSYSRNSREIKPGVELSGIQ